MLGDYIGFVVSVKVPAMHGGDGPARASVIEASPFKYLFETKFTSCFYTARACATPAQGPESLASGRPPLLCSSPSSGECRFNSQLSKLSTPSPRSWIQEIFANFDEVRVRENIVRSDGSETVVSVRANFDGQDYPVEGSPAADMIAYTRVDQNTISGTGKKNGIISWTETVTVVPEKGTLTLSYSLHCGSKVVSNGIAVFEKHS